MNAHIKICRQNLGVHNKAMRIPVQAQLGRFPISLKIVGQIIAFWAHFIASDVDSYATEIYSDMIQQRYADRDLWLDFIINIFRGIAVTHVWDNSSLLLLID